MIQLVQYPKVWGLPNPSPFCWKVENYLRMTEEPYERIEKTMPIGAPMGKLPYIKDGGSKVPDSTCIIQYLKETRGDALDKGLGKVQRATAHMVWRLCDEHLYWAILWYRAMWDEGAAVMRDTLFDHLPGPFRALAWRAIQPMMASQLRAQGLGRHPPEEILARGRKDLDALAEVLGDKPHFLGQNATSLDACTYAFLGSLIEAPIESPLKEAAFEHENLVEYCHRMKDWLYPDGSTTAAAGDDASDADGD